MDYPSSDVGYSLQVLLKTFPLLEVIVSDKELFTPPSRTVAPGGISDEERLFLSRIYTDAGSSITYIVLWLTWVANVGHSHSRGSTSSAQHGSSQYLHS